MRHLAGLLFVALHSTGCGAPDSVPASTSVETIDGIRTVINIGTADAVSGWSVARRPLFRTGWEDDEPTFESIRHGYIREDGGVVVADRNGHRVYAFSEDGMIEMEAGGRGDGPGEFQRLASVISGGPGRVVAQDGTGPVAVFQDGRLVQTDRVTWGWVVGRALMELEGRTPEGDYIAVPGPAAAGPGEGWVQSPILRVSPDLVRVDTLTMVDHFETYPAGQENSNRAWAQTVVGGRRIIHVRSDLPRIEWRDLTGELVQVATWDARVGDVDAEDWAAYEEALRNQGPGREMDEARLNQMIERQKGQFRGPRPTQSWVVADQLDNAWIARPSWAPGPVVFDVVSADGTWLGYVTTVEGGRIVLDISHDRMLVVERDDYDVEAIAVYEILKPE